MKYLSDKNYITYTPGTNNRYVNYVVYARQSGTATYKPIYTGRLFVLNNDPQYLYLDDIIRSRGYNTQHVKPGRDGGIPDKSAATEGINIMQRYKVDIAGLEYYTDWILGYYKDANLPIGPGRLNGFAPDSIERTDVLNPIEERTSVLPRIPKLATSTRNFWFAFDVFPTTKLYEDCGGYYRLISAAHQHSFTINASPDTAEIAFTRQDAGADFYNFTVVATPDIAAIHIGVEGDGVAVNGVFSDIVTGNSLYDLTRGQAILLEAGVDSMVRVKVADIDECPAPFYAIWLDRTGVYQCQPFQCNNIFSETITSSNTVNFLDEKRPYIKSVTPKWSLYTDWMDEEHYKAYESLLTSPYIYLYDTEKDLGAWVNCTTESWTDKTYKNQKKLFNLNVSFEAIANQDLRY